jgi:hypothetical protein
MDAKQLLMFSASMLASAAAPAAQGGEAQGRYVQIAEIEVHPAQIENFRAAVNQQIEAAIQTEAGVLVLYAVTGRREPRQGVRGLSRCGCIQGAPRSPAFQEVQGNNRNDGTLAQARPCGPDRPWRQVVGVDGGTTGAVPPRPARDTAAPRRPEQTPPRTAVGLDRKGDSLSKEDTRPRARA